MSLFKCKMCGGDLEIADGMTIAECEYCGAKQTVPKAMDENLQNLFNRANTLRIKNEFDKAEKLYEKIIQTDTTQSEAYWGLILCKYGIEYVDDPKTFKKIPTCHRASYDSIIADDDYKSAIENADLSQRAIYEEQAKEIDRIQKEILNLAQREEAYDVFICYKETDADGRRTQDSVIANDIYYQLKNEGFKVFYAAITLEGKLGSAYEPIIFAALNSARVMLSIGTKPEYFNAVWVKNEWSRFLKIIQKDRTKLLIPCYRDMDAYELPEKFAHLQAQDMSKIGFINDIVRGIKKVVKKDEPKVTTVVKETVITSAATPVSATANTAPLIKRIFMFLEDSKWAEANEYCEKVLDLDPECADAYLGKLLAELKAQSIDRLKYCSRPFNNSDNYKKIMRFANEQLKTTLRGYINDINTRNENDRVEGIYNRAKTAMQSAKSENEFKNAASIFKTVPNYKDSQALSEKCFEKAETARKDSILADGKLKMSRNVIPDIHHAINIFSSISGWRDADEQIAICKKKIENLKAIEEAYRLEKARLAEAARKEAEQKAKRNKKIAIIATSIVCVVIIFVVLLTTVIIPNAIYNNAMAFVEQGNDCEAYNILQPVKGKSSKHEKLFNELTERILADAKSKYLNGKASEAADILSECGIDAKLQKAYQDVADGNYKSAISNGLTNIVIPDSMTSIGDRAFEDCEYEDYPISVTIPNSVTSIGNYAFRSCSHLTSIVIPNSVTSIGRGAFENCRSLTSIIIPDSVTSIGSGAFKNCTALKNVTLSNSMTSIGDNMFYNCQLLTGITIPNSVTSIGRDAFENCDALTSVTIPDSVTSIGEGAFYNCDALTSVTIPDSVTSIGDRAFKDCKSLKNVSFGKNSQLTRIGQYAFENTGITSITIPSSVTSMAWGAFSDCTLLEKVSFGENSQLTRIGEYVFNECTKLTSIVIPDSVTSIDNGAFYKCSALTSVTIPVSVTSIGDYAFNDCLSLTSINFKGTTYQWYNIEMRFDVFWGEVPAESVQCSDGRAEI